MHPMIIKALAVELVADRTTVRPPATQERRQRRRPGLVWITR